MGTRYHYIRNFMTDRPLMNWGHRKMISLYYYPNMTSFLEIRRLAEEGKLTPAQAAPRGPRVPGSLKNCTIFRTIPTRWSTWPTTPPVARRWRP